MGRKRSTWTRKQKATFIISAISAASVIIAAFVGILPDLLALWQQDDATSTPATFFVTGRVFDADTEMPVSGAKVTLEISPVPLTQYTDEEGAYTFALGSELDGKVSRITVIHEDYQVHTLNVLLSQDKQQIEQIYLSAKQPQPLSQPAEDLPSVGVWQVHYFNNPTLDGAPVYSEVTPAIPNEEGGYTISFNRMQADIPGLAANNYSIRWVGVFDFDEGYYEFHCEHRDGCRTFLDGRVWVDAWWDGPGGHNLARDVSAGQYVVVVEFYDKSGVGFLDLLWRKK